MAQTAHITAKDTEIVSEKGSKKNQRNEEKYKPGYYGPDYEKYREQIQKEINESVLKNDEGQLSYERFAKTPEEKKHAKLVVAQYNAMMRAYGVDPKKQMNLMRSDYLNYRKGVTDKNTKVLKLKKESTEEVEKNEN